MRKILPFILFFLAVPNLASAGMITISEGTPADLTNYTSRDLPGLPDPWPAAGAVVNPILTLSPEAKYDVIYRGGDDDAWLLEFAAGAEFDFDLHPYLSNELPGASLQNLGAEDVFSFFISNEAGGVGLTDHSIALQQTGNFLEIGWTGTSFENDYGYKRFAVIATPIAVPEINEMGLPLALSLLLALMAFFRERYRIRQGYS